jgi:hypothetical protein
MPQNCFDRSSGSTNSMPYVRTPSTALICVTTRAESSVPREFRSMIVDPTRKSLPSWTAAPCRFRLVALAGMLNEAFWRSSPDKCMAALNAIRLLRRFEAPLRTTVALWKCLGDGCVLMLCD